MWHLEHELEPWFERVEEEHRSKFGGDDTAKDMEKNEYAAQFRK